jgi:hypothetical protein
MSDRAFDVIVEFCFQHPLDYLGIRYEKESAVRLVTVPAETQWSGSSTYRGENGHLIVQVVRNYVHNI